MLNRPEYADGSVLVAGDNFGCGSSREHAPWALQQAGFKAIIAPSFGDIFFNNSAKNGLLLIRLPEEQCKTIADWANGEPGFALTIDLENQTISDGHGLDYTFEIEPFRKHCLLNGLDDIGLTLDHEDEITAFESEAAGLASDDAAHQRRADDHRRQGLDQSQGETRGRPTYDHGDPIVAVA